MLMVVVVVMVRVVWVVVRVSASVPCLLLLCFKPLRLLCELSFCEDDDWTIQRLSLLQLHHLLLLCIPLLPLVQLPLPPPVLHHGPSSYDELVGGLRGGKEVAVEALQRGDAQQTQCRHHTHYAQQQQPRQRMRQITLHTPHMHTHTRVKQRKQ